MDRLERFYKIDQLLQSRRIVSREAFLEELEVSLATFKRDLEYMRDRFNAPVLWDAHERGYRYENANQVGQKFELPGLWFDEREAHALLTMQHLLASLDQGGLIGPQIEPLMARLNAILGKGRASADDIKKRFRILTVASRKIELAHFSTVGAAVSQRDRLQIRYHARGENEITEREISPQRLIHYRENWYVDAWCHLRDGLRSFAIDSIQSATPVGRPAKEVSTETLEEYLVSGYGIFGGQARHWAKLRFSADRARWVAAECWHPNQRSQVQADGSYLLEIPYSMDQELVMDILRHGGSVEVIAPEELRAKVREEHQKAADQHR